jgi:hypothetical protein
MNPKNDILNEVEIYLSYGKTKEAVTLLEEAIKKYPSRTDLKKSLYDLRNKQSVSNFESSKYIGIVIYHVLFISSLLLVAFLIRTYIKYFGFSVSLPDSFAIVFTLLILSALIFAFVSIFMFCFLWFKYLEYFSEKKYLSEIEKNLQIHKIEPIYSFAKKHFYAKKNT